MHTDDRTQRPAAEEGKLLAQDDRRTRQSRERSVGRKHCVRWHKVQEKAVRGVHVRLGGTGVAMPGVEVMFPSRSIYLCLGCS